MPLDANTQTDLENVVLMAKSMKLAKLRKRESH